MYLKLKPFAKTLLVAWLFFLGRLDASEDHGNTNETKIVEKSDICNTEECRQVAKALVESMNRTVDPCDDFYQFSCGNWELNNPAPKYEIVWNLPQRVMFLAETRLREELETESTSEDILPIQHVKKLYKSCMDNETRESEGIQKIGAILQETKGWPMTMNNDNWSSNSVTWQEVDRYYGNLIGLHALFTVDITDSLSEKIGLEFSTPIFPLREKYYNFDRNYTSEGITAYRSVIRNTAQLFIQQNKANVSDEKLERDIDDLLKFEESLYKVHLNSGYSFFAPNISAFMEWWNDHITLSTPRGKIDWEMILRNLGNITSLPMIQNIGFRVMCKEYFLRLVEILESTDERTIVNYIQWNLVSKMLPYTTEEVDGILLENMKNVFGVQEMELRWLECVRQIKTYHAAAYLFSREYYQNHSKTAVDEMVRNLKASLKFQIENSNWLTVRAKEAALEKLSRLLVLSGYPDWYDNETAIVDYYGNLTIVNSYFENVLKLKRLEWIKSVNRWGQSAEQVRWTDDILRPNGKHSRRQNIITITTAALQTPLFDEGLPDYVKYGTVGTIIAHELGHGFDSIGIYFGADPIELLFYDGVRRLYTERVQCFIEKFNTYFEGRPENVNSINNHNESKGVLTLDENLADWIGVEAALDAYKKLKEQKMPDGELKLPGLDTFTDEQMFFISFAQAYCAARSSVIFTKNIAVHSVHAPEDLRVIGVLSNTLAFSETFKCSKDSLMNAANKCDIWMNQTVGP